jgi:hypothetical protein
MPAPAPADIPLLLDDALLLRDEVVVSVLDGEGVVAEDADVVTEAADVVTEDEGEDVAVAVDEVEVEMATEVYAKPVARMEKYAIKSAGAARLNVSDVSMLQFGPAPQQAQRSADESYTTSG